jgi:hypothetical protein
MEIKKFEINEGIAKDAKMLNSFGEYRENEATDSYNGYLARFETKVENMIKNARTEVTAEKMQAVEYYAERYSARLAKAINRQNTIRAMMPSIMISGGSNFNVRKKEKQNNLMEKFWHEYGDIFGKNNYYINKIDNILNNITIYSNDDLAIEKLEEKIKWLTELQEKAKRINAYYRKNKTMTGFETLSDEGAKTWDKSIQESLHKVPYAPFELSNNNANINRLKDRVEEIKKLKERAGQEHEEKYPHVDGIKVEENGEDMRIRLFFEDIPSKDVRELLKSNGFKWSPKNSAWQRQLTRNGIYATKQVLEELGGK